MYRFTVCELFHHVVSFLQLILCQGHLVLDSLSLLFEVVNTFLWEAHG